MESLLIWILSLLFLVNAIQNISLEPLSVELPAPLSNHISSIYQNSLFIIGGFSNNSLESNTVYSALIHDVANSSIHNFNVHHNTQPAWWQHHISCSHQCDVAVNERLYIVQTDDRFPFIIIYDMNINSYIFSAASNTDPDIDFYLGTNPMGYNPTTTYGRDLINGCIVQYNGFIFIIGSVRYQDAPEWYNGFMYQISSDSWRMIKYGLSGLREGIACAVYNNLAYLFGGKLLDHNVEAQYIEKCTLVASLSTWSISCHIVIGSMYPRSYARVLTASNGYFVIYGGITTESRLHIEIFNPETEQINELLIHNDQSYNLNNLNVDQFGSSFIGDHVVITGGINVNNQQVVNDIKYTDIARLFINNDKAFDFPCSTTYNADGISINIDDYLLTENDKSELIFEVYEINGDFTVGIESFGTEEFKIYFNRANDKTLFDPIQYQGWDNADNYIDVVFRTNMSIISQSTNIDMIYNHSAFWMKWSTDTDKNGNALSVPYWRMGFGDITDRFGLMDYLQYDDSWLDFSTLFMGDIVNMNVKNGKYIFYTDICSLNMDSVNNNFAVGDYFKIIYNLTDATSLNVPIYIKSDHIVGIDHSMYILENDDCLLCNNANSSCSICAQGIKIEDLLQYNVDDNYYKIDITSELNGLQTHSIALTRIVMNVEIRINFIDGLYPGSNMYITPIIHNETSPSQPNGTIVIHFDPELSFKDDTAEIFIDFNFNLCIILYDERIISCSQPILIPSSMNLKTISQNAYTINAQSHDLLLIGSTSFTFHRQIQTLLLEFDNSVYLGQNIKINAYVVDDTIYQQSSTITVTNSLYSISSAINIQYDSNSTESIERCEVETQITNIIVSCDEGISFQSFNGSHAIDDYIYLSLDSEDTYLEQYNISNETSYNVLITHCPNGYGISGSTSSSYSCTECPLNQVGISSDSQCINCGDIRGVTCLGSSYLIVSFNYWMSIHSDSIISTFCPAGFCCQHSKGCNYTQMEPLCATNRDPNVPLCGGCLEGYSEVFGSTACKKCDEDNWSYLIYPFCVSFLMVLIIIMVDGPANTNMQSDKPPRYSTYLIKDDFQAIQISFLRPILYFFQSMSYITVQTGFWFYLSEMMTYFAFDFMPEGDGESSGICFVKNMKSIDEQFWYLFFPFCMFLSLFIFGAFHMCLKKVFRRNIKRLNFRGNIFWNILLILIGNIISKMLKIIGCSQIGDVLVHFYGGYLECFGIIWYIAAATIIIIIVFWIVIWFLLYRMDGTVRDSRSSYLRTITKPYKINYWYWEIVLISRRTILSVLIAFQYVSYDIIQYILLITLILYLCIQIQFKPFKHDRVNIMDSVCMLMLIIGSITVIFEFHRKYPNQVAFIMTMVVFIPIILFITYCILVIKHFVVFKKCKGKIDDNTDLQKRIEKVKSRLTGSQKLLFSKEINFSKTRNLDQEGDEDANRSDIELYELPAQKSMQL